MPFDQNFAGAVALASLICASSAWADTNHASDAGTEQDVIEVVIDLIEVEDETGATVDVELITMAGCASQAGNQAGVIAGDMAEGVCTGSTDEVVSFTIEMIGEDVAIIEADAGLASGSTDVFSTDGDGDAETPACDAANVKKNELLCN